MYAEEVDIVLATLNARYSHAAMGLRCLRANLGPLRERAMLVEGVIDERPLDFVEKILAHAPRVVGLSVYIWNTAPLLEVVRVLKSVAPDVVVVLGGPEVSYEVEDQEICDLADYVIRREGERAFAELCTWLFDPSPLKLSRDKVIDGGAGDLDELELPYDEYDEKDLARRNVYLEASRGCPFRCAFCLSALDKKVRPFGPRFLDALDALYACGLRHFRFVDRTFNLDIEHARAILERFLPHDDGELFLHFEMVPDRLPDELFAALAKFSPGAVQLEVGFQTFNEEVARTIDRRTRYDVALTNLSRLRDETGVHIHADLIAGLPGEDLESFGRGFDRLFAARPHEIQLGILKRLKGYPLEGKDAAARTHVLQGAAV